MRGRPTLLVPALLLALVGCDDGEALAPGAVGDGEIQGVVARQKTGGGVDGVVVALLRDGRVRRVTVTDGDGAFAFRDVEQGSWRVRPAATELAGLDVRFHAVEPEEHTVTSGGGPGELVFAVVGLLPPRIMGRVTCGGVGRPGVEVRVVGGATDVVVETGAEGLYSVLELHPGSYVVLVPEAPCALDPPYRIVELRAGQLGEADFREEP